jgi:YjbE family integral membrane protein
MTFEALLPQFVAFFQVVLIDIAMAGDNAIVVGMAASRLPADQRKKVIFYGLAIAVVFRIIFAGLVTQLYDIIGLRLAGGLLLVWVAWKLWLELRESGRAAESEGEDMLEGKADTPGVGGAPMSTRSAMTTILVADISMSLDNVLAVAGAAKDHLVVMALGLLLSVGIMAVAANFVARLLKNHPWVGYLGLAVIVYVACQMIWHGSVDVDTALQWGLLPKAAH